MTRIDEDLLRAHLDRAVADHDQVFEKFFLARLLNLEFTYLPEDAPDTEKTALRIRFPMTPLIANPQGVLHGGIIATVMDISMGHLIGKIAGPPATIEMKVQYLRAVSDGSLTCESRFLRRGRSISFMESRMTDGAGRDVAHATATWKMPAGEGQGADRP